MQRWDAEFPECDDLTINVNLSARQCLQPDLVTAVARILAETGLPAPRLKLEITEGVVLENSEAVVDVLNALRDARRAARSRRLRDGLFGAELPAAVPVPDPEDRPHPSSRACTASGNAEIIRAIVSMAEGLAMDVTAEGIETAEQVRGLRALDCEYGQGYFFHKPLSEPEARIVLQAHRR